MEHQLPPDTGSSKLLAKFLNNVFSLFPMEIMLDGGIRCKEEKGTILGGAIHSPLHSGGVFPVLIKKHRLLFRNLMNQQTPFV